MALRDPVGVYARSVASGKVPACKLHRQAAERHLADLVHAGRRGLTFDRRKALEAIERCRLFRHTKGEWRGRRLELEPWQQFVVGSLFGWRRRDGTRRFRTAYIEIPRKNGKSTLVAAIVLLATFLDGEPGAEGYCAATMRDQARIVFDIAREMVSLNPALRERIEVRRHDVISERSGSFLRPLSADAHRLDGLNPHAVAIDELHAHPTGEVVQVMKTAVGSRREPLLVEITTAGNNRHSVCWQEREFASRVLDPHDPAQGDSLFAFVTGLDEGDDWRDPASWEKANPNWGVSVKEDSFRADCERAQAMPSEQNSFRQKRLNEWVNQAVRAIDMAVWDEGGEPFDEDTLIGRRCFGGLDLARTRDVSAFVLLFPPEAADETWKVLARYWIPDEDITERSRRDRVPYERWRHEERIVATPGNVTDFDFIEDEVLTLSTRYEIAEVAFDRTFAGQITTHLGEEGLTMVPFGQGYRDMGHPTDEMMRLLISRRLQHGGCPVLRWMADNLVVVKGPAGTDKPDKQKSREKIDGIVALVMALGRAMVHTGEGGSAWERFEPLRVRL